MKRAVAVVALAFALAGCSVIIPPKVQTNPNPPTTTTQPPPPMQGGMEHMPEVFPG